MEKIFDADSESVKAVGKVLRLREERNILFYLFITVGTIVFYYFFLHNLARTNLVITINLLFL